MAEQDSFYVIIPLVKFVSFVQVISHLINYAGSRLDLVHATSVQWRKAVQFVITMQCGLSLVRADKARDREAFDLPLDFPLA